MKRIYAIISILLLLNLSFLRIEGTDLQNKKDISYTPENSNYTFFWEYETEGNVRSSPIAADLDRDGVSYDLFRD